MANGPPDSSVTEAGSSDRQPSVTQENNSNNVAGNNLIFDISSLKILTIGASVIVLYVSSIALYIALAKCDLVDFVNYQIQHTMSVKLDKHFTKEFVQFGSLIVTALPALLALSCIKVNSDGKKIWNLTGKTVFWLLILSLLFSFFAQNYIREELQNLPPGCSQTIGSLEEIENIKIAIRHSMTASIFALVILVGGRKVAQ